MLPSGAIVVSAQVLRENIPQDKTVENAISVRPHENNFLCPGMWEVWTASTGIHSRCRPRKGFIMKKSFLWLRDAGIKTGPCWQIKKSSYLRAGNELYPLKKSWHVHFRKESLLFLRPCCFSLPNAYQNNTRTSLTTATATTSHPSSSRVN